MPPEEQPPGDPPRKHSAFRRAFQMDDPRTINPSEEERVLIDKLCAEVVRRHMTLPATMMLETSRPLGGVASAALHFFEPFATAFVSPKQWGLLAAFLERRGAVDFLIARLEELERQKAR